MINRVTNPNCHAFKYYGARGISICDRWLEVDGQGFSNFLADMGECPKRRSLDRIDVNGNYEPGNCRWATPLQQVKNRRPFKNNTQILTQIEADEILSHYSTLEFTQRQIGHWYGVSQAVVSEIVRFRTHNAIHDEVTQWAK